MERPSSSDLGLRVVNEIYDSMRIDAEWSVWDLQADDARLLYMLSE